MTNNVVQSPRSSLNVKSETPQTRTNTLIPTLHSNVWKSEEKTFPRITHYPDGGRRDQIQRRVVPQIPSFRFRKGLRYPSCRTCLPLPPQGSLHHSLPHPPRPVVRQLGSGSFPTRLVPVKLFRTSSWDLKRMPRISFCWPNLGLRTYSMSPWKSNVPFPPLRRSRYFLPRQCSSNSSINRIKIK